MFHTDDTFAGMYECGFGLPSFEGIVEKQKKYAEDKFWSTGRYVCVLGKKYDNKTCFAWLECTEKCCSRHYEDVGFKNEAHGRHAFLIWFIDDIPLVSLESHIESLIKENGGWEELSDYFCY